MKRLLEISGRGTSLRLLDGTLSVQPPDQPEFSVPPNDLASVLLSTSAASVSGAALAALSAADVPLVVCDGRQFPCGLFLPFAGKSDQTRVLAGQIAASLPVRKRLWQALVRAKLENQAAVLAAAGRPGAEALLAMAAHVRSGDAGNLEARGARLFWDALGVFASRVRGAPDANRLFDYAYTVLLSLAARHVCAAGLHPGIGLHHRNGRNAFCLASDLVEPLRTAADRAVLLWLRDHPDETDLVPDAKRFLVRETLDTSVFSFPAGRDGLVATSAPPFPHLRVSDAAERAAVGLREALLSGDASRFAAPRFRWEDSPCG